MRNAGLATTLMLLASLLAFVAIYHTRSSSSLSSSSSPNEFSPLILLSEKQSLCATQAVKLGDCDPNFHSNAAQPEHSKYSPYVIKGKPVPWKTVQEAVKNNPNVVMTSVLKRTKKERQKLDDIDLKEEVEQGKVQQTLRRLVAAKRRLEAIQAAKEKKAEEKVQAKRREKEEVQRKEEEEEWRKEEKERIKEGKSKTREGGSSTGSVPKSLILAMATTMKAEQSEIAHLRRQMRRMARGEEEEKRRAAWRSQEAQAERQGRAAARSELALHAAPANRTASAATNTTANNGGGSANKGGGASGRGASGSGGAASIAAIRNNLIALAGKVNALIAAKAPTSSEAKGGKQTAKAAAVKKPLDPRQKEDQELQKKAEKAVAAKEAALVAAEEGEQQQMKQMQSWSRDLSRGGLHTIGYTEYGLPKAMYDYTVTKSKAQAPTLLKYSHREEAQQLAKAGVSSSDIAGAFHLPLPSSNGHAHVTMGVHFASPSSSPSSPSSSSSSLQAGVGAAGTGGGGGEGGGGGGSSVGGSVTDMKALKVS